MLLILMMSVPVTSVPTGIASATPADGCTSGTLTVHRDVVGYEFWNVEQYQQAERLPNTEIRFPGQLRYTVVTFATNGNVTADCTWTVPEGVTRGHLLVVGGGGAGGTAHGGGGGGGGVFYGKVPITTTLGAVFDPGAVLQVTVGAGGTPAAIGCTGAACAGGEGGVSSVSTGGTVRVSAGGGGGGGGDGSSAPAVSGTGHSAGGGGGGAALTDDGTSLAAGAAGASSAVANDPYLTPPGGLLGGTGGPGEGGAAAGTTRYSGGGGGAKGRAGGATGPGVGAGGVGISLSRGGALVGVTGGAGVGVYGAGGGGFERGLGNCGTPCFNYFAKGSASPASGGAGGTSGSGGQGVDGTGGGGGGAAGQGGRGGAGIVMIAFPEPIVVTGPGTLSATFGAATTSAAYSYTNGNPSLATPFRVRAVGATAVSDSPPAGISMDASRRIVVSTSVAPGTYDLVVLATNDLGTEGSIAVTLTVNRAVQQSVTFATAPPADARVGFGSYSPVLTGGDGTGAYVLAIDPTVPPVCTMEGGVISFLTVGTCTVVGSRAGDSQFEPSDPVVQNFSVTARDAQAAVVFASAAPSGAVVGDSGDEPQFSGGSGTGAFLLTSTSLDVCTATLSGSTWSVAHAAPGTCELSVVREGDGQYQDSAAAVRTYVVAPDCGQLVGGVHRVATAAHLASVGAGGVGTGACGLGASYLQTADITLLPPVAPATSNHVPIGDGIGFTGVYDGGGHTIAGLVIDLAGAGAGDTGLFDSVRDGGLVERLTLSGAHVRTSGGFNTALLVGVLVDSELRDVHVSGQVGSDRDGLGGLVGYAENGTIRRASATVTVAPTGDAPVGSTNAYVGGLVGWALAMTIEDATADADVTNAGPRGWETGGLIGRAQTSNIARVRASGSVDGTEAVGGLVGVLMGGTLGQASSSAFVTDATAVAAGRSTIELGGLVGWAESGAALSDVIATGDVTVGPNAEGVGGLIGRQSDLTVTVVRAIAAGRVSGSSTQRVGGLIGDVRSGGVPTPLESYWDVVATGQATSAGGTGLTTAQITSIATFSTWPMVAGWAAYDVAAQRVWGICAAVGGGYPFLLWRFDADPCGSVVPLQDVPEPSGVAARSVSCTPVAPRVGDRVVCTLAGGDASEVVEWRASYNPQFAGGSLALDDAGAGGFTFVIPTAASGSPVILEVVGWGDPIAIAERVGAPIPGSIPAGQGSAALEGRPTITLVILAWLAMIGAGRRRSSCASARNGVLEPDPLQSPATMNRQVPSSSMPARQPR